MTSDAVAYPSLCLYFGKGIGPIFMEHTSCTGSETYLVNCSASVYKEVSGAGCAHNEDAGVKCLTVNLTGINNYYVFCHATIYLKAVCMEIYVWSMDQIFMKVE